MITSISKELYKVKIPKFNGEIQMLPFDLDSLGGVPIKYKHLVSKMIGFLPIKKGIAYLTVDGKLIKAQETQRRGGAHIDGNYLLSDGVSPSWTNGGWKVGGDGKTLTKEEHKLSYENSTGGMLICSDYPSCKGWNGVFEGVPNMGGDCSHIVLQKGFKLKANTVYYGNSQWIHESLPLDKTVHRTLVRITLPTDYPTIN